MIHDLASQARVVKADANPYSLTRDERSSDSTGTPYVLVAQAFGDDDLSFHEQLTPLEEANVLVEFPCGGVWTEKTGYHRIVRWRERVLGCTYGIVREPRNGRRLGNTVVLDDCPHCGYKGRIEHGLCAICGQLREPIRSVDGGSWQACGTPQVHKVRPELPES